MRAPTWGLRCSPASKGWLPVLRSVVVKDRELGACSPQLPSMTAHIQSLARATWMHSTMTEVPEIELASAGVPGQQPTHGDSHLPEVPPPLPEKCP